MGKVCIDCGTQLASRGKSHIRCKPCAGLARRKLPRQCRICGTPTEPGFDRCRECYWKSRVFISPDARICPDCGGRKGHKSAKCSDCFKRSRRIHPEMHPLCTTCGTILASTRNTSGLCRKCAAKRRNFHPKTCEMTGCIFPVRAKGLCKSHYESSRKKEHPIDTLQGLKAYVRKLPCAVCGYDKTTRNVHRIIPSKGYTWGNVAPLCPNCHAEVHLRLISHPEPIDTPTSALADVPVEV